MLLMSKCIILEKITFLQIFFFQIKNNMWDTTLAKVDCSFHIVDRLSSDFCCILITHYCC